MSDLSIATPPAVPRPSSEPARARLAGAAALLLLLFATPARAQEAAAPRNPADPDAQGNVFHDGASLPWGEPDGGMRFLALYGSDYSIAGQPFAFRLHVQPGFEIAPHTHPGIEHLTILSGVLHVGLGETMDREAATAYGAGSYLAIGARVVAYMWAEEETVVQVHGVGPFSTEFVTPGTPPDAGEPASGPGSLR